MKFTMACGTWIKDHDEKVLEILQKAETMPTVEELMEMTGLRRWRVEHTLKMWRMQIAMAKSRKRMKDCDGLLDDLLGANWRDELKESGPAEGAEEDEEEIDWSSIDWGE